MRWKQLGSGISTARMISRLGGFTTFLKYFVIKINKLKNGEIELKNESPVEWLLKFFEVLTGIFDNWQLMNRIKLVPFWTDW